IILLLLLDMFLFHKKGEIVNVKKALWLSLFWICFALVFNMAIYFLFGKEPALEFLTAYLIEKSLSVDNLFVFILIFTSFKISPQYQHDVLFWGILGALVFRAIFIFAGITLLESFAWIMYLFGGFLVVTGIKMATDFIREGKKGKREEKDLNNSWYVKLTRKIIPVTNDISIPKFFRRIDHKIVATPFFLALVVIEFTDLVFAIDSIPAVLAVSTDMFIVYTSNIFAILGLRSLYFALRGVVDYFHYLKYALSVILLFIGGKMMINHYSHSYGMDFYISTTSSLLIIILLIAISIIASIFRSKQLKMKHQE
ncbi:MAG: TerC/Alx family metal homeostasis membrane protein, partial [Bacteroidales bacterium]|nr:TerC/Alx family metal homeostasis membrane protein [Bacteroidales bacterium]